MTHRRLGTVAGSVLAALAPCAAAPAQPTNISPVHKYCWGENVGWLNWRDAGSPAGAQGARIGAAFLSGFVWGESIGWVNLGDGSPANGTHYANTDGADCGVNIDAATGDLFGLAWGEAVGWINFDTRAALAPFGQQTRWDSAAQRLRGYAWGENVGWINLDDDEHFVAVGCAADYNGDGVRDVPDIFAFLTDWFAGVPRAVNFGGTPGVPAIFAFLSAWFAGCP